VEAAFVHRQGGYGMRWHGAVFYGDSKRETRNFCQLFGFQAQVV
jgi:hypothetical protein